jgi:hypothetical protein
LERKTISSISSDFEKANVLKQVTDKGNKTEQQWTSLMNAATDIDSDFEKANVLNQKIANHFLPHCLFLQNQICIHIFFVKMID